MTQIEISDVFEHHLKLNIRHESDIEALKTGYQQFGGRWFYFEVCLRLKNTEVDLIRVFSIPALTRDGKNLEQVQSLFKYKVLFDNPKSHLIKDSPYTTDQIISMIQKLAVDGKTKMMKVDKLINTLLSPLNKPDNSGRFISEYLIKMAISQGILKGKMTSLSATELLIIPSMQ